MAERRRKERPRPRPQGSRTERDVRRRTHSQNFIRAPSLAEELVRLADVGTTDLVLEPGAGTGVVTEQLAKRAGHVIALEIDPAWVRVLRDKFDGDDRVTVLHEDVFRFELPKAPFRVFGNIPFGSTTQLLHLFLDDVLGSLERADLIVQLEVARKRADTKRSNALNLSWQPWFDFRVAKRIPATAFRPVPTVDAALLSIKRRRNPLIVPSERDAFVDLVRAGVSKGGLLAKGLCTRFTANQTRRLGREIGFSEETRASSLGLEEWTALYAATRGVARNLETRRRRE